MDDKVTKQEEFMPDAELFDGLDAPYEDGFSFSKTMLGALFVGFIMLPGAIYLGLVTGQSIGGAAEWVTIILFIEIAKRCFVQLKKPVFLQTAFNILFATFFISQPVTD